MLRGLFGELAHRAAAIADRLSTCSEGRAELQPHALTAYRQSILVQRKATELRDDPGLVAEPLWPNYLSAYRRASEQLGFVESFPLPFLERYSAHDQVLTSICARLTGEIRWPIESPVIGAFSSGYFWTSRGSRIVGAPAADSLSLLTFPDLVHELGHHLCWERPDALLGSFVDEVLVCFYREIRLAEEKGMASAHVEAIRSASAQWLSTWLDEFVADMVATYILGPPYAWQHLRLVFGQARSPFSPSLGESSTHPADEARLRGVLAVLDCLTTISHEIDDINGCWNDLLRSSKAEFASEYRICYPPTVLATLARRVVEGGRVLGIRSYRDPADGGGRTVTDVITEGWERFRADPDLYKEWEVSAWSSLVSARQSHAGEDLDARDPST